MTESEVAYCKSVTKIQVPQAEKMRGKEIKNGNKKGRKKVGVLSRVPNSAAISP